MEELASPLPHCFLLASCPFYAAHWGGILYFIKKKSVQQQYEKFV
jgi:hypothetical protein